MDVDSMSYNLDRKNLSYQRYEAKNFDIDLQNYDTKPFDSCSRFKKPWSIPLDFRTMLLRTLLWFKDPLQLNHPNGKKFLITNQSLDVFEFCVLFYPVMFVVDTFEKSRLVLYFDTLECAWTMLEVLKSKESGWNMSCLPDKLGFDDCRFASMKT